MIRREKSEIKCISVNDFEEHVFKYFVWFNVNMKNVIEEMSDLVFKSTLKNRLNLHFRWLIKLFFFFFIKNEVNEVQYILYFIFWFMKFNQYNECFIIIIIIKYKIKIHVEKKIIFFILKITYTNV